MSFLCVWIFTSILGTVVETKQMSTKDRWRGRSTWGCGGGSQCWWPGWWAGSPAWQPGTWTGTLQREGAAVLDRLRGPGGGIVILLSGFLLPCSWCVCWGRRQKQHSMNSQLALQLVITFLLDWSIVDLGDFPGNSDGKETACIAGDSSLIPGLGRSPGEGIGYPLQYLGLPWWSVSKESTCNVIPTQRSLVGCSPWGQKESDTTEWLSTAQYSWFIILS